MLEFQGTPRIIVESLFLQCLHAEHNVEFLGVIYNLMEKEAFLYFPITFFKNLSQLNFYQEKLRSLDKGYK